MKQLQILGPYFVVEPLLPGGTLLALVFWLSQKFVREGFDGVRQYAHAPRAATPISAVRAAGDRLGLCLKRCAVIIAWRDRIRQRCEHSRGALV